MEISEFKKLPIIGILRGVQEEILAPLVTCIIESGLKTIEITMNTKNAASQIEKAIAYSNNKLTIGAGTVMTMRDLETALNAGASFIVMPTINDDILAYCLRNKIPVFPGALTPNEIYKAWQKGATMVKVFPSSLFGPAYFKEIKAPFNNIELLACGGITSKSIKEYFEMGASGAAFGASIFKQEWLENKNFASIKEKIVSLVKAYKE